MSSFKKLGKVGIMRENALTWRHLFNLAWHTHEWCIRG